MATKTRERPRVALAPEEVRRLSRISAPRAAASLAQTFGLAAALVALAVHARHPLVVAACVVAMATQQHALGVLAHEAAHQRLFETRWVNDLVGRVCGIPIGLSLVTYRVVHRVHHLHLYSAIDPDLALMAGYPRGRAYLAWKLVKDLAGLTTVKTFLYFFGKTPLAAPRDGAPDVARPVDDTSPAMRAAAARDRTLVLVVLALAAALAVATGAWRWALVLWVLPLVTVFAVILRLRAVIEHGAPTDERDVLRATRTTLPGWLTRALLFPHHVNFHVEHHLYPSVPHYRLAECHAALVRAGLREHAQIATVGDALVTVFAPPRDVSARAR